jgi:hypothetical protein
MNYNISAKKAVKIHQINSCLLVLLIPLFSLAQISTKKSTRDTFEYKYGRKFHYNFPTVITKSSFSNNGEARLAATALGINVTIAVLDA